MWCLFMAALDPGKAGGVLRSSPVSHFALPCRCRLRATYLLVNVHIQIYKKTRLDAVLRSRYEVGAVESGIIVATG